MTRRVLAALAVMACLIGIVVLSWAAPVQAQECPSMADFLALLAKDYGESPVASGSAGSQAPMPMMMFANMETGTWTMVAVVGGCARAMASGDHWTMAMPTSLQPGEDI